MTQLTLSLTSGPAADPRKIKELKRHLPTQ
jgi:hypothetical protein